MLLPNLIWTRSDLMFVPETTCISQAFFVALVQHTCSVHVDSIYKMSRIECLDLQFCGKKCENT